MGVSSQQKTFYIETFGCQMNFHDSEKVVGTLISEGYRQVQCEEEADLIFYNTCSIRDKAEQKVFHRLADFKKLQDEIAAGNDAALKASMVVNDKFPALQTILAKLQDDSKKRDEAHIRELQDKDDQLKRYGNSIVTAEPSARALPMR